MNPNLLKIMEKTPKTGWVFLVLFLWMNWTVELCAEEAAAQAPKPNIFQLQPQFVNEFNKLPLRTRVEILNNANRIFSDGNNKLSDFTAVQNGLFQGVTLPENNPLPGLLTQMEAADVPRTGGGDANHTNSSPGISDRIATFQELGLGPARTLTEKDQALEAAKKASEEKEATAASKKEAEDLKRAAEDELDRRLRDAQIRNLLANRNQQDRGGDEKGNEGGDSSDSGSNSGSQPTASDFSPAEDDFSDDSKDSLSDGVKDFAKSLEKGLKGLGSGKNSSSSDSEKKEEKKDAPFDFSSNKKPSTDPFADLTNTSPSGGEGNKAAPLAPGPLKKDKGKTKTPDAIPDPGENFTAGLGSGGFGESGSNPPLSGGGVGGGGSSVEGGPDVLDPEEPEPNYGKYSYARKMDFKTGAGGEGGDEAGPNIPEANLPKETIKPLDAVVMGSAARLNASQNVSDQVGKSIFDKFAVVVSGKEPQPDMDPSEFQRGFVPYNRKSLLCQRGLCG